MRATTNYGGLMDRSKSAFRLALGAYVFGVIAFYLLGCFTGMNARYGRDFGDPTDDVWPIRNCLYHAGITFTTVGFTDELGTDDIRIYRLPGTEQYYAWNSHDGLVPARGSPHAESRDGLELVADYSLHGILTTVLLAVVGMAVFVYSISTITSFFVEGAYLEIRQRKKAERAASRLRHHFIVCGGTPAGLHTIDRFVAENVRIVAVEGDPVHSEILRERFPAVPLIRGAPTDIDVLLAAGLEHAHGLITALADDTDNLVVIVSVKQVRPDLRILSRASDRADVARLLRAGADEVVTPAAVGGLRMASEAIRPTVVRLLDTFVGHEQERHGYRVVGLEIGKGTAIAGRSLGQVRFGDATGTRVVALRYPGESGFTYNPGADIVLTPGTTLAVVANDEGLARVRALMDAPAGGAA